MPVGFLYAMDLNRSVGDRWRLGRDAGSRETMRELFPHLESGLEFPTIDNREPEPAGRHRVHFRKAVVVEGDLNARNPQLPPAFLNEPAIWMPVMRTVSTK